MDGTSIQPESLWNDLLSRQPERVSEAFNSLDPPNQKIVLAHLQNMVKESGWQSEQRISAKAALQALEHLADQEK